MSKYDFKVPVSGQKIPHGWFAALVRFMNSLILSGDGRYTMVDRNESGTTVTLTPAVIDALNKASGGTPAAGGGGGGDTPQDLTVDVTGNTATVGISGSTATAQFVGKGDVSISGNTNGQIEINVSGGGSYFPDWDNMHVQPIVFSYDEGATQSNPYVLPYSGFLQVYCYASCDLEESDNNFYASMEYKIFTRYTGKNLFWFSRQFQFANTGTLPAGFEFRTFEEKLSLIPVKAGTEIYEFCSLAGGAVYGGEVQLFY